MVKAYLRYEAGAVFGVVASAESNICYDCSGKLLFSGALENLSVWNVKQGLCVKALAPNPTASGARPAVTSIAWMPSSISKVASGYDDGSIRIWDSVHGICETTLNGHRGATTALRYSKTGSLLASGSKDTDIIIWDVLGESGLFRLHGHRGQVTDLLFLDSGKKLVSCSKDKFVRVWDLETQHCMQIVVGHHSEIWSLDADPEEHYLVTGSSDLELRFYKICQNMENGSLHDVKPNITVGDGDPGPSKWDILRHFGEIQRQSKDRVVTVRFNATGNLFACQGAGKTVEIFNVMDEREALRKAKKRAHRKKEKTLKRRGEVAIETKDMNSEFGNEGEIRDVTVSDTFRLLQVLRMNKKICSVSFCSIAPKSNGLATIALSLSNNVLEVFTIQPDKSTKTHCIELPGHRSDIRSVTLNADSTLLLSTSYDAAKIWNPSTGSCLRTIESQSGVCGTFVPGNQYALVGTKTGKLEIIDVGGGVRTEMTDAHTDTIWSIISVPDGSGFITGSADHDIKFWEYLLVKKDGQASEQMTVQNVWTLKMKEAVLAVRVSPDAKYMAVSLYDNTVKVYFLDSQKFFLSLYGHKLPVHCIDISSDGDLLVSGSLDKNVKIWGLDFGDCHKSIYAHTDSVMAVQFVRNTHYFFSAGKDRLVKYWDADKFELLLTLEGHHSPVWCLAVSHNGDFVISGSHDRSIRRWDRTQEPFFIEEEREKRLEEIFESGLGDAVESVNVLKEDPPEQEAVGVAGKQTKETISATDSIIDALDMAEEEAKRIRMHEVGGRGAQLADLPPNLMMLGLSPSDYVLRAVSSVQTNDLEPTLLSLPFTDALKLMAYLKDWTLGPDKVELVCKIATFLVQTHHNQLIATPAARPILTALNGVLHKRVKQLLWSKSDAPFRNAKAKLLEIRARHSNFTDRNVEVKGRQKRKKASHETHLGA
ncbi:hypothetical protein AMTRI_Chr09g16650 [Amborella trichopoda]